MGAIDVPSNIYVHKQIFICQWRPPNQDVTTIHVTILLFLRYEQVKHSLIFSYYISITCFTYQLIIFIQLDFPNRISLSVTDKKYNILKNREFIENLIMSQL